MPYVGQRFVNVSHIHYYVSGYRPLAWAIPLEACPIAAKDIESGKTETIKNTILEFAKMVNIKTNIKIQTMLL